MMETCVMVMPPDMAVDMRYTKLKPEEVALITGEVVKPSWESRNEGIHERVNFEDTIWGFDLAGGVYYRTPLRVTFVKPESRADKAGIRIGDRLLSINGVDTSTLTIQEAHELIREAGLYLKLEVTAPEDISEAFYYYEDPIVEEFDIEEERLREEEEARRREVNARVSSYWSLQWPWVSKRRIIFRESNCFMVPSKYEEKHREKFPLQPSQKIQDDIVLHSAKDTSKNRVRGQNIFEQTKETIPNNEIVTNGDVDHGLTDSYDNDKNNHINSIDTEQNNEISKDKERITQENNNNEEKTQDSLNETVIEELSDDVAKDNKVISEVFKGSDSLSKSDEDNILDSILSDNGQNTENSESMNER